MQSPTCPICESGELSPITYRDTFQHNGSEIVVSGLEGYECPVCGADPVFEDQIRRNHRRIVDAKRHADGLLTGEDIRALRERLHLTQKDASALFGGGANAFSKYERGDVVQSVAMDRLLRLIARFPYLLTELLPQEDEFDERAANDQGRYVSGDPVRLRGSAYRSSICDGGHVVVVENDEWKRARAA